MNAVTIAMVSVWVSSNILLFFWVFRYYVHSEETFYIYRLLGPSIAFSRASAACLNMNVSLALLPICRQFATTFRNLFGSYCVGLNRRWRQILNSQILMHRLIGYGILVLSLVHVAGHVINIQNYIRAYESHDNVTRRLAFYRNGSNFLNPITSQCPYWRVYLTYLPGTTGLILLVSLLVMFLTYMQPIRSRWFELFWSCHHAFMLSFVVAFVLHGCGGIVRVLKNADLGGYKEYYYYKYKLHNPKKCLEKIDYWGAIYDCPSPEFVPVPPATWKWIMGPLSLFFLDKTYRILKPLLNPARIAEVVLHPSSVVELQFTSKSPMRMEPGQYVRVNFPLISRWEWHPFTLTSVPGDAAHSVHIRAIGDWTRKLFKFFEENKQLVTRSAIATVEKIESGNRARIKFYIGGERKLKKRNELKYLIKAYQMESADLDEIPVYIDGPYGAPTQDWFLYDVAVFIGAGIGVTPFASILKHVLKLMTRREDDVSSEDPRSAGLRSHLKRVYFFWICPQMEAFEWFHDMLEEMECLDDFNKICCHVFLTKGWNRRASRTRSFAMKNVTWERDPVTGLRRLRTEFGRPRWDLEMSRIGEAHPKSAIGVFHCGPERMAEEIRIECQNMNRKSKSTFNFIAESFT